MESFTRVFGQKRVKEMITKTLGKDRLAHAYLFHGQPGIGKDAMAVSLAMGMNCSEGVIGGCGKCDSCVKVMNLDHPNVDLVLPVPSRPKSMKEARYQEIVRDKMLHYMGNLYRKLSYSPELSSIPIIGIAQIRLLKKEVALKINGRGHRIFIFSQADSMTPAAANCLLKLLEEPPPQTLFILTTAVPQRLLLTIISRCQSIRFDPVAEEEISGALIKRWKVPQERAKVFAKMAGGSLQRALDLMEESFEDRRERALAFLHCCLKGEVLQWIVEHNELIRRKDKEEVLGMLNILLVWFRDLYYFKLKSEQGILNIDCIGRLKKFQEMWGELKLQEAMIGIEQAIDLIQKNVYLELVILFISQSIRECRYT